MEFSFLKHSQQDETSMGLSSKEADSRLREFGANTIEMDNSVSPVKIFLSQFKDVFVIILLVCTALSFLMGETVEAIAIVVIVVLNSVLGFVQEYKTEKTLDALRDLAAPTATVIRDKKTQVIKASDLVPGDLVVLEAGDRVPADCVLISSTALECDESLLTGESVPVMKEATAKTSFSDIDEKAMVYMGTLVVKGRGRASCYKTGMDTQMGQIADMLDKIEEGPTPLQKRLSQLAKFIALACVFICAFVAAVGYLRGEDLFQMIVVGISLAVAAVPEGLPAVVTISLALAVSRMLKRGAVIRKLHAVETLGCASVICSDKTGTLTQNKMTVKEVFTLADNLEVTGDGYQSRGEFFADGIKTDPKKSRILQKLMLISLFCNNATISNPNKERNRDRSRDNTPFQWDITGDPTEAALLIMCAKGGMELNEQQSTYRLKEEFPFDSVRKCMSVVVEGRNEEQLLVKGAPDILLEKSKYVLTENGVKPLDSATKRMLLGQNEEMAKKALRVLSFAYKIIKNGDYDEDSLVFVGLTGMIDPPRETVKKSVSRCIRAGIKPVMITGDHKITAKAIAEQIGIYNKGDKVVTGTELDQMSDDLLRSTVKKASVFARVKPEHKLRIVKAYKANGHVVAMTGDGVNDAPAIKEADIGVAMGIAGTDVTKEAASVILLDDDFSTIVDTVEEGRVIYQNIRKFIRYLLSCNIGEVLTMFLGMLMGMPIILIPIQILMVNLVTDGLPAIALGLDPPEDDVMKKTPRRSNESVFSRGLLTKIVFRGCIIGLCTLGTFVSLFKIHQSLELARTGAFMCLVLTQLIHVFECKSESKSLLYIDIFNNMKLVAAVLFSLALILIAVYFPPARLVFKTVPMGLNHLAVVFFYTLIGPLLSGFFLQGGKEGE